MNTLLIVDDSTIIRQAISNYLKKLNLQIIGQAVNGAEALEAFKKLKPDLVTMDITMPKMDGLECLEQIMAVNPDAKVLIISALSDPQTGLSALRKGAAGFITKPFKEQQLIEEVEMILAGE